MNRLGFRHDNVDRTLPEVAASRHLQDRRGLHPLRDRRRCRITPLFGEQRDALRGGSDAPVGARHRRPVRHAANSAALLRDERVWYDFVRPGLLLYGVVPPPLATTIALRPALSLHSRIVAVKGIRPGEGTGYGLKTTFDRAARRSPSCPPATPMASTCASPAAASCSSAAAACPIVGSVCMDMTMIDVTGTDVAPGDDVVIVGEQVDASIDVREIAASIGTIPYELLCRVGSRIQRVYS